MIVRSIGSRPQAGPPLSGAEILQNARALATRIREKNLAAEYDRLRRLPDDIVAEIRAAGIMRMNMPRIWGGPEMTAMEQVETIEALARADASIAWCAFIWCDSGIYSGYLDDAVGREMYPHLDMATSGWVYPAVPAHRVATSLEAQWKKLERGEPLTVEERADSWLSRRHAFQTGRDVVSLLYDTIGASAIYSEKSPFDRHLRDLQTACQYLVGQTKGWEGIGPLLLGGEPAFPFI